MSYRVNSGVGIIVKFRLKINKQRANQNKILNPGGWLKTKQNSSCGIYTS